MPTIEPRAAMPPSGDDAGARVTANLLRSKIGPLIKKPAMEGTSWYSQGIPSVVRRGAWAKRN